MKKAVAIPYVIALIFGVIVIAVLAYWLVNQSSKTTTVGSTAECQARQSTYCQQWKALKFGSDRKPFMSFPTDCTDPSSVEGMCLNLLSCVCRAGNCLSDERFIIENHQGCTNKICCPV